MFSSVRWPLALAFFAVIVICVAFTEVVLFAVVRDAYLESAEDSLRRDCSFVANLMGRHMDQVALTASERRMITDEMVTLSVQMSGRMCIVNWQGKVLEDSAGRTGENVGDFPEVHSALSGRAAMAIRGQGSEDWQQALDPGMYVAVPMLARGKVTGAIYGSRSLADLQWMLLRLRERLYQVAAGSLGLALLISLGLARWLARPLRELTRVARGFGEGQLQERIPVRSRDEIGTLARSFNDMADRLEKHREALLQFVSDASHELKTPLASLRSVVEALEAGALEDPLIREKFLAYIHRDLDRMEKLVADLLDLHRLEHPDLKVRLEKIDLAPLLDSLGEDYGAVVECSPGAAVQADPDRLRQVLTNLLDNARRAVRDVPAPSIRIKAVPGQIRVEDNGVGLAPEHLERIFDRFYRVDRSRSREDGGTGLGLAITRRLVEAMGGRIEVSSEGPGLGARFRVTLGTPASVPRGQGTLPVTVL
ncbi:MAG: HAMP domain-containing histidine kinase [Armatimonadetes bacterium]|nr:HAMP domain-containing histidine kinase [Armatimonadota bacterium]